ncbi:MAG: adenine deaminase C-terminal domain-containing protein [Syntrophales bacterium]
MSATGKSAVMQEGEATEVMQAALGRRKADLVVVNARVANVYTGEILDDFAVAVKGKWIAYVGREVRENIGEETVVVDAAGMTVIPGFIETHTHLAQIYDSAEFTRFALKGGTTTVVTETMEVFPVGGYEGVIDLLDSFRDQPLKVYGTMPAMVSISRACNGISIETIRKLLLRDDILGLGESYWQSVLQNPEQFLPLFAETLRQGKKVEGHSAGAGGRKLMAYAAIGASSCHEPITAEEVLERLRLGIYVMLREGSIRRDLEAVSGIKDMGADLRRLILTTDSVDPGDLLEKGYMEYIVQKAIDVGFSPMDALRMATINAAGHFSLDGILGGIAPGKYADMVIIPDLQTIRPECVIASGKIVAKQGELLVAPVKYDYASPSRNSIHLPADLLPDDFSIRADTSAAGINVRVMDLITELVTREVRIDMPVIDGMIHADPERDIIKVAAIDRTHNPGSKFIGLVRGFKMKAGAFATSTAWDTSDIVVVGVGDADMALAVNRIRALQGGIVVCRDGEVIAEFALPIWGVVSEQPMEMLVQKLNEIKEAVSSIGVSFSRPHLTLGTLTTGAIPYLRICEEGLVNLRDGQTGGL